MTETQDWLKTTHNSIDMMRRSAKQLCHIANQLCFTMSEDSPVVRELHEMADGFFIQWHEQDKALCGKLDGDLRNAQEMSGAMLKAVLHGCLQNAPKHKDGDTVCLV